MTARRLLLISALTFCAAAPAAGAVVRPPVTPGSRYLALGDSVTFGYQEPQVVPAPNYHDAGSFTGYPEQLGPQLKLNVNNAACPAETSTSFINTRAKSNGCENVNGTGTGYRSRYPLHVRYRGSQLAYAIRFLRVHRNVRLVSLMIGADDLFLCQKTTTDGCLKPSEEKAVLAQVHKDVRTIVSAIRNQAHYRGQLMIVNYYSLDYSSTFITGVVRQLNQAQDSAARPFGVSIADGFGTFATASRHSGNNPCKAGLLTQLVGTTSPCGVHTSYAGSGLLAQAVAKAVRLR